jgi:hypothetical protein
MASIAECCESVISTLDENSDALEDVNKKISDLQEQNRVLKRRLLESNTNAAEQQRLADEGETYSATIIQQSKTIALEVVPQMIDTQRSLNSQYEQKNFLLRNRESINRMVEECKTKDYNGEACNDVDLAEKCCQNIPPEIQQQIAARRTASINIEQPQTKEGYTRVVPDQQPTQTSNSGISQNFINNVSQFTSKPTTAEAAAAKRTADAQQAQVKNQQAQQTINATTGETPSYDPRQTGTWGMRGKVVSGGGIKTLGVKKPASVVGPASPPASRPTSVARVGATVVRTKQQGK